MTDTPIEPTEPEPPVDPPIDPVVTPPDEDDDDGS